MPEDKTKKTLEGILEELSNMVPNSGGVYLGDITTRMVYALAEGTDHEYIVEAIMLEYNILKNS